MLLKIQFEGWTLKPLKYHRDMMTAAGVSDYLVSKLVGPLRLRVINANDYTTQALVTIFLKPKSSEPALGEGVALVARQWQQDAGIDVGWEGDIVMDANMEVVVNFESSVAADALFLSVGYEQI